MRVARAAKDVGKPMVKFGGGAFARGTEIVTGEGEVAVLFRDGSSVAVIPAGKTRVLDPAQAPFLARITAPDGSLQADVYFVTTSPLRGVRFGTRKPVNDPRARVTINVQLSGEATLQIGDPPTLVLNAAANPKTLADPIAAMSAMVARYVGDAVSDALGGRGESLLDAMTAGIAARVAPALGGAIKEARAGVSLLSLDALDVGLDAATRAMLEKKAHEARTGNTMPSPGPEAARKCPGCGVQIAASWAKFCPECGATLPA